MVDMFPFPSVAEGKPEKQIADIVNYLIQFKETLEFALTNISAENLSPELVNKLNEIGMNIDKSKEERTEEVAQISKNALTIPDVCNSNIFKNSVRSEILEGLSLHINFDTGHLEYSVSYEEEI